MFNKETSGKSVSLFLNLVYSINLIFFTDRWNVSKARPDSECKERNKKWRRLLLNFFRLVFVLYCIHVEICNHANGWDVSLILFYQLDLKKQLNSCV